MQENESKFTGGLLGLIGVNIVTFLLSVFTLGLGIPAAICFKERWYAKHTYINGKQLVFNGTGGKLFGQYIKWILLSIITFGIYSFWLGIKMKQWVIAQTSFADENSRVTAPIKATNSPLDLINNEDAKFKIILTSVPSKGSTKIEAIKILRENAGIGLADAKQRVENMGLVQRAFTQENAEILIRQFEAIGVSAEIENLEEQTPDMEDIDFDLDNL